MTGKVPGVLLSALMAAASAQGAPPDHYTAADLAGHMKKLKAATSTAGVASEALQQYPNHFTMLAYRSKDGGGELHRRFADIFYVVRGKATLVTGGMIPDAAETSPGELRGKSVVGGERTALGAGDIVHIPAGTPHQLLIAPGHEFLYFVVKVKERD